jgi:hypothetical protein
MPTIVGVFNNGIDLERALYELDAHNIRRVCVIDHEPELTAMLETGAWIGFDDLPTDDDMLRQDIQTLQRMGIAELDAFAYAECVQRGKKLVAVRINEQRAREILEILAGANAITDPIIEPM